MSFLTGIEIRKEIEGGNILVESLDNSFPFDHKKQVTEDSIDLRLFPKGLKFVTGTKEIDFLHDDLKRHYENVTISPIKGFMLKPNEILFGQTLEAITFPDYYVGQMFTRATFAQLGIMVTCGAPKFAAGISWAFPLQITNCGSVAIRIYPYTVIAQLMISKMIGEPVGYPKDGRFQKQFVPTPPSINDRERNFLKGLTADSLKRIEHIESKIAEVKRNADDLRAQEVQKREEEKLRELENLNKAQKKTKHRLSIRLLKIFLGIISAIFGGYAVNLLPTKDGEINDTKTWILFGCVSLIAIIAAAFALFLNPNKSEDERD